MVDSGAGGLYLGRTRLGCSWRFRLGGHFETPGKKEHRADSRAPAPGSRFGGALPPNRGHGRGGNSVIGLRRAGPFREPVHG